ncbi:hypothetical protein [Kurthia huakuii]|uniref:hypothetical protein n=1 Tax=Kurthia huakuii TaxID=1421019 RepID=UPI000496C4BB|nr:hypothetical protein [Kurthia huakuii]MBM7699418.1 hypothetical protein [Kurthia huakuii]
MWILFGVLALVATFFNFYLYVKGKDYQIAMALGLSFTALTVCAEYTLVSDWVKAEDWTALMDVVPSMETALWVLTVLAIAINLAPVFLEAKRKK